MVSLSDLRKWFEKHRSKIREDYFQFLRFRSVSADPAYSSDTKACAEWLCDYLKRGGLHAELLPTQGYPIVFAEEKGKGKTVLAYGHYDVQPIDPIELWKSDPFEPTEREGKIFARGACDDKGQIFYALLAALAWKDLGKAFPIHLKFCIEGEEESQSLGLLKALPSLREKLRTDDLLIVDFDQLSDGSPAVSLGARGIASLEVVLRGSISDLHSGMLGGIAYNPNRALAELLAQLWDEKGRVAVPGFYEDVEKGSPEHYFYPYDKTHFTKEFGIRAFGGEKESSLQETNWFQPTLEINGMGGGYAGNGMKTVIPAQAFAKLSMRLVPHQKPEKVLRALEQFLKNRAEPGMEIQVISHGGEPAWRGDANSDLANAVVRAAEEVTEKKCFRILSGASIPVVANMAQVLHCQLAGMGFGKSSDNIHAPNEHFDMKRLELGFLTFGRVLALLTRTCLPPRLIL